MKISKVCILLLRALVKPVGFGSALVLIGTVPSSAQERVILRLTSPEIAGISGYRLMWNETVLPTEDGLRVIVEPKDKDYAIRDRGGIAPWAPPTLKEAGKSPALAFDAMHRTLLVRFPDSAEKIATQIKKGYRVAKLELLVPFQDEELWPEGGGFSPGAASPGYGYTYRANWGVEWGYRAVRPRWHALASALRKPWVADAELGPTYNAHIKGAGYWGRFGAQDEKTDRLPRELKPAEVSWKNPEGRIDLAGLLDDADYGKTLAERLRQLADCGVTLKKWETYDHLYYQGDPYEWGTGVGGRAIIIRQPALEVTFEAVKAVPDLGTLAPPVNVRALAGQLKGKGGGKPTAVMPDAAQIKAYALALQPRKPQWMPDWQWQSVQQLFKAQPDSHPDDPAWIPYLNPFLVKTIRSPLTNEAGKPVTGPVDLVRSYEMWVDQYLQRPLRGFHGHGTISDLIQPWFEYRTALPEPVHQWFQDQFVAFLMPDRPTADSPEKRADRNYVAGPLVHPMVDSRALGAAEGTTPDFGAGRFDTYVAKTGDWRGNKSFYRSGFNYTMSTQNFNNNASLAALLGGGIIQSKSAVEDGRRGQMDWATRQWTWFDGSIQEELDDYYLPMTVKAAKMVADYGPTEFDRLLGRSQLAKINSILAESYHPGLRRYVYGASRTSLAHRLGTKEGLYAVLHSLSRKGALTDLAGTSVPEGEPKWGHDTPPGEIARLALVSPFAPDWFQHTVDEKPLPHETTSSTKKWGGHMQQPIMRRSYLGQNFGIFSENAQSQWLPITAHWRRKPEAAVASGDLGTMVARFGVNETRLVNDGPGWIRVYGMQATLQSGPRMLIASSPGRLDAGYRIKSLQHSLAFYNYELPAPTWEIYVDGTKVNTLPFSARAGQRITIKDGVSFIGIIPLPSTDLGRKEEVVLRVGEKQEYLGTHKASAALVVDNILLQRDTELPQTGTDWEAIDKGCGGFLVEYGDAGTHANFAAFQQAMQQAKVESRYDAAKALNEVSYRTGNQLLEMGVNTNFSPGRGSADNIGPLNSLFAYQRVNGRPAYLPVGVDRDSPSSQQGTTGTISKGGAVLRTSPGRTAMLQYEAVSKTVAAWNPLPDLSNFQLDTATGVKVRANGKIGLTCLTYEPARNALTVEHSLHESQTEDPTVASALLVSGLQAGASISLNGRVQRGLASVTLEGKPAVLLPLRAGVTAEEGLRQWRQFQIPMGALPAELAAQNLALRAQISASSEADKDHIAGRVADGKVAEAGSKQDTDSAWAAQRVMPPYQFPAGIDLVFQWPAPVRVAEVVYYGRTAWLWTENFKDYEIYVDEATTPVYKGTLKQGHGPQRITLPAAVQAKKLKLKFLSSYGDYCPGAAEIQIFSASPPTEALARFMPYR